MSIRVFGIRHHGPGCARSLRAALEALEPDIVLVEGPPDGQEVIPLLRHQEMKPPVALLIYAPANPKQAVYYPFTVFSPEWQALDYTLKRGIPGRFMDLPQAFRFAEQAESEEQGPIDSPQTEMESGKEDTAIQEAGTVPTITEDEQAAEPLNEQQIQEDPLALLAQAAGYSDHELWWEREIEQRQNANSLFESILEAITVLRGDKAPKDGEEALREAHMRQSIRQAQKEGYERIAVVCGAWHAPVLVNPGPGKADTHRLKGLKRAKVEATWIPWTNSRLSYRSGYGAGVNSPGWYEHLWTVPNNIIAHWTTRAAHLLRQEGLDASSASIIETVRLADALAAMRDLAMPGLAEMHEVIQTVLCNGNAEPMELIREKLEIGERLGQVPAETPMVPLQRDLELLQKQLRLKASAEITKHDFDLRNETDRGRSQLLHRMSLLGIQWGKLQRGQGNKLGTFHEYWQLQWQPEFAVPLIEANIWGSTIEEAATNYVSQRASATDNLPELSNLLDSAILAELPGAIDQLLREIQRNSVSADVQHMMNALPPLARIARYGDVRQTKAEQLLPVIDGLFERVVINLPGACFSLDDDAASSIVSSIDQVQDSVQLLNRDEQRTEWLRTLRSLVERESIHGLVRGRSCRLLLEQNALDEGELQQQTGLALSPAVVVSQAAAWIEGMLRGGGLALLHQDGLWRALDGWLCELDAENFEMLLPILRRAFSGFQASERRKMGEKLKHLRKDTALAMGQQIARLSDGETNLHPERADRVLPVLAQLMGVTYHVRA